MDITFVLFAFILGSIIGSFLNVVVYRSGTGMTFGGRSKCFTCGRTLAWTELVPILSYIVQGGACKKCKSRISIQYPLVELGTGILFALVVTYFPPLSLAGAFFTLFYLIITSILVAITAYDIRHKIIPNPWVYTFSALAFAHVFFAPDLLLQVPSLLTVLSGPLLALPFYLLWKVSQGRWIGLGDAKLVLGIGWVLGLAWGISAVILSFWIGAIISVLWMWIAHRKFKAGYEIPFGPYLILGMYLVLFWRIQVFDVETFVSLFVQ